MYDVIFIRQYLTCNIRACIKLPLSCTVAMTIDLLANQTQLSTLLYNVVSYHLQQASGHSTSITRNITSMCLKLQTSRNFPKLYSPIVSDGKFTLVFLRQMFVLQSISCKISLVYIIRVQSGETVSYLAWKCMHEQISNNKI